MRCPKCSKETFLEEEKREKNRKKQEIIAKSGIPVRFANRTFDTFLVSNQGQQRALDAVTRYAESLPNDGQCLIMCGSFGVGKTHLAVALMQHAAENGVSSIYTTTYHMIRRIRETWKNNAAETERAAICAFTSPDVLVLDEVGVQNNTESERLVIFDIMNSRYDNRKPTVLLSNYHPDKMREFLGERVSDRLREDNVIVMHLKWESYREAARRR